jgi:hypothetical protein
MLTEENRIDLTARGTVQSFIANVEFDDEQGHHDEPAIILTRSFMIGVKPKLFVFPLSHMWIVREPRLFADTLKQAAEQLFSNPTKHDEHLIGDIIHRDIDAMYMWRPDDDAAYNKNMMHKEIEQTGLKLEVNGKTVFDA